MSALQIARPLAAHLSADERGATAVEYGLMVALIAVIIVLAVAGLAAQLSDTAGAGTEQTEAAGAPSAAGR